MKRGDQVILNLEINEKRRSSNNIDIHHSKVFSSVNINCTNYYNLYSLHDRKTNVNLKTLYHFLKMIQYYNNIIKMN